MLDAEIGLVEGLSRLKVGLSVEPTMHVDGDRKSGRKERETA